MRLTELRLSEFRNLADVRLHPDPKVNWLYGENGAGKTSVLEAIFLLSRGRSFRSHNTKNLIREGSKELTVFARGADPDATLGMSRSRTGWHGRIDGERCQRVSQFAETLPLILIEPSNHQLVQGGPELRRAFMDWGLFHVEPSYLQTWRRYSRLLQQRNAALKTNAPDSMMDALESLMEHAALNVDRARVRYISHLKAHLDILRQDLGWRFSEIELEYPGVEELPDYRSCWIDNRTRDREQGYTREGPHRADLKLIANKRPVAPRLSRGQQKLTAILLLLAQLNVAMGAGKSPLLLLDDPVSELDDAHLASLLDWVSRCSAQVWIAAVDDAPGGFEARMFHVEQGTVTVL